MNLFQRTLRSLSKNKQAMMGVSTLIIFISAILTSAVAAAVIVRTVGILQERSFTVTTEIRDRLVTALDIISVSGYANVTSQKMYGVDALVRTRAGSYSYSLESAGFTFVNEKISVSAGLQHSINEDYDLDINNITSDWYTLPDMDRDKQADRVRVSPNYGGGTDEFLEFEFTRGDTAYFDLDADFDAGTDGVNFTDEPIIGDNGKWYGFMQIRATGDTGNLGVAEQNSTHYMRLTHFPELDWCDFSKLIPEDAFCYETRLGDGDPAVSKGEIYVLRFKLRPQNYMTPDESFQIKLIPKKGDFTEITGTTPDSFVRDVGEIWPTGS
ncbi:MAG: hypothetical protein ACLFPQ_01135 [Candidatus Woesearchaeota archaeon]